jgi:hypothetical protein
MPKDGNKSLLKGMIMDSRIGRRREMSSGIRREEGKLRKLYW